MADLVVDQIKADGGEAAPNYDNVSTIEGGQGILKSAIDAFGQADILINNAGILRDKSFAKTTEDLWDPVIAVHLKGTYCVTLAVYNHMKERGQGGVIINTSSTSGLNGNFGQCNSARRRPALQVSRDVSPSKGNATRFVAISSRPSRTRGSPKIFRDSTKTRWQTDTIPNSCLP